MSTVLVDLPSRLVDALNEQDFPMDTEATRGYRPVLEIEATEAPAIWVTPRQKVRSGICRPPRSFKHGLTLEVLVQRSMAATTGEDDPTVRADEISVLAEAVEDYLCNATITPETEPGATPEWVATTRGDVTAEFSPERYAQGVMAWVITATFWLER